MRLLKEVGAIGSPDPTYEISVINPVDLINCAAKMAVKYKLEVKDFDNWKSKVKEKAAEKVRKLKISRRPQPTK